MVLIVVIPLYSGGFSLTHVYNYDGMVHYRLFEAIDRAFQISKYVLHILLKIIEGPILSIITYMHFV